MDVLLGALVFAALLIAPIIHYGYTTQKRAKELAKKMEQAADKLINS